MAVWRIDKLLKSLPDSACFGVEQQSYTNYRGFLYTFFLIPSTLSSYVIYSERVR